MRGHHHHFSVNDIIAGLESRKAQREAEQLLWERIHEQDQISFALLDNWEFGSGEATDATREIVHAHPTH